MAIRAIRSCRAITSVGSPRGVRSLLVSPEDGKIDVELNCKDGRQYLKVQRIINCSGPQTNIKKSENLLLKNMIKSGMIAPGPLNLGIKTNPDDYSVITADNKKIANLLVIGSNLKGTLWETTAVPELRLQAKNLASHIRLMCLNNGKAL